MGEFLSPFVTGLIFSSFDRNKNNSSREKFSRKLFPMIIICSLHTLQTLEIKLRRGDSGRSEGIDEIITNYPFVPPLLYTGLGLKRKLNRAPSSINTNFLSRTNFSELTGAHRAGAGVRTKK